MKRFIACFVALSVLLLNVGKSWGDLYYVNFAPNGTITQNPLSTSPGAEPPTMLNDNTTSGTVGGVATHSKWLVNNYTTATPYVIFSYDQAQTLDAYALVTGNDSPELRQPTAWTIFGSNDQNEWTVLDQRTGYAQQPNNTGSMFYVKTGELDSTTFKYFKFQVDQITGNSQALMQLAELQLYTMKQGTNLLKGGTITCTQNGTDVVPTTTAEGVGNLIDSVKETKFCVRDTTPQPTAAAPYIITYTGTNLSKISAYALTSANDKPGRSPSKWTLSGSYDNGATWTDLASQSALFTETFFNQGFELAGNDTAYLSYKLTITQRGYDQQLVPGDGAFQLADIRLYGEEPANSGISLKTIVNKNLSYDPGNVACFTDGPVTNLFDGDLTTKWGIGSDATPVTTPTLYFSLGANLALNSYTISARNESGQLGRNPNSWTLYGQNAAGDWVALDTQTGIKFYEGTDYTTKQTQTFSFTNSQAFKDYKLAITANDGSATQFQMAEFDVSIPYSALAPEGKTMINLTQHPAMTITAKLPAGGTYGNNEGLEKLFDGNTATKMCRSSSANISPDNSMTITFSMEDDLNYVLKSYSFTTGNDAPERDPQAWKIYGFSPVEDTWILLDDVSLTGDLMYTGGNGQDEWRKREWNFLLDNDNAWSKYAFEFTGTRGASAIFQMSEMELWGYAGAHTEVPEPAAWLLLCGSLFALIPLCRRRVTSC